MLNFRTRAYAFTSRQAQHGLSLIEMMISITIGLIILSAMATLFSNQSKVRSELDKSNRMIDNGRYALEVLSSNLSMAGFYGSYVPASGAPASTPDPCNLTTLTTAATNLDVLRHHVQGYDATSATDQIDTLPATCALTYTSGSLTTLKDGSDILALRRTSTATPVAAAAVTAAASTVLQVSNCSTALVDYQVIPGDASKAAYLDKDCSTVASLRPFIVQVYFVSPDSTTVGDGIPTLKRRELDQATGAFVTTPLVEGIEYMQVDYGLDADADGSADSYIAAPTTANWPNIVSVKLNIIARNVDPTASHTDTKTYSLGLAGNVGPFNAAPYNAAPYPTTYPTLANYKRHAYTQVVRLVNASGRLAP